MIMTAQQVAALGNLLTQNKVSCPVCKGPSWAVDGNLLAIPCGHQVANSQPIADFAVAVCEGCGYSMNFSPNHIPGYK
jgi:C4-type Zn-finger protein